MTFLDAMALKSGQWIRWHSHLDHHVDGEVTRAEPGPVYHIEWEDGHISHMSPADLERWTFEVLHVQ